MNRTQSFKLALVGSAIASAVYLSGFALNVAHGKNTTEYKQSFHVDKHYSFIQQPSKQPAKHIALFFWYGSPSSYDLDPKLQHWSSANSDVTIEYIPATLNKLWLDGARTFYSLSILGAASELHNDLYYAYQNNLINDKIDLENFLESKGIKGSVFWEHYFSGGANKAIKGYSDIARNSELEQIPTMIVSGKYKINTSNLKSWSQAFDLANFLIKQQPSKQVK